MQDGSNFNLISKIANENNLFVIDKPIPFPQPVIKPNPLDI